MRAIQLKSMRTGGSDQTGDKRRGDGAGSQCERWAENFDQLGSDLGLQNPMGRRTTLGLSVNLAKMIMPEKRG